VALSATIYNIDIDLADADRGVYEALALRVARHPSESEDNLVARVLAYALEYTEGIAFSKGLSDTDEPAIYVRDLTGGLRAWIDVGQPDAARLHKASKACSRVAVYMHREPTQFLERLEGARIHRAAAIELWAFDRAIIDGLVARLERRMTFSLAVNDRELYLAIGSDTLTGELVRYSLK